ncbi:MAG: N-acetyltransferase [Spirulina sp. SIO3F2]|nr:N-acetyltransferase [Spirulina sp. SIO3F2]
MQSLPISATALLIRPAQAADCGAIAAIYNESIAVGNATMDRDPKTAAQMQTRLHAYERECWLVAEQAQQVVGWGAIKQYSDRWGYRVCCESSIYLTLGQTGQGYGSQLQTALIAAARSLGYHHIVAKIMACNDASITFHQRFGFEIVGCQKEVGYLNGRWHDVVILQLILPDMGPDAIDSIQ